MGAIIQAEGKIVNAKYQTLSGKKALASILMEIKSKKNLCFVSEPEVVLSGDYVFEMTESQFLKFKNDYFEQYEELNKLRPDNKLKLHVDFNDFYSNLRLSKIEFDVLCDIIDFPVVEDIYLNCDLLDFDITTALISLRKKGVIKVLGA
mgnify:CR=1 FL=1